MANKPPSFNFTFGAPSTPVQPQQQQQQAAQPAAQLQVPSFTFGQTAVKPAATGGIQFGTPTAPTAATSATGGLSLGFTAPSAQPAAAPSAQPGFGFPAFGAAAAAGTAPVATSAPVSQPSLGLTFTAPTPAAPSLTLPGATTTTAAAASPFTLSTPQTTSTVAAPSISAAPALTIAAPSLTAPTSTSSGLTAASMTPATATTTAAAATLTASTTVGGAQVGQKTAMKFGELEQLVASRRAELEQAGRAFIQLAAVLANRDAELRRSAVKLVSAESELDRLRMTAETLDRELDYADTQTTELEGVVDDIERQLVGVGGTTGGSAVEAFRQPALTTSSINSGAGGDRSSTLQMAVSVDAQLRASARQLRSLSERVNSITGAAAVSGLSQRGDGSAGTANAGGGMATLTRLLDSQLRLLEWAESTSSQLQRRIDVLSNRVGNNPNLTQTIIE